VEEGKKMSTNNLVTEIKSKLRESEYWVDKTNETDEYIQNLKCPECHQPRAWTYAQFPWVITCNRLNNCGAKTNVREIFPWFRENLEKEFAPNESDPNRPATAYLQARGLSESLNGLEYRYDSNIRRTGCGGVLFRVADGIWNGRIIHPPPNTGKTHNIGKTKGHFWKHPKVDYDYEKEIFVTEGIIDALSFIEIGKQAIALLSAGQSPSNINFSDYHNLVFAFDNDSAGKKALKKWNQNYPDAKAVMPHGGDWNDLLVAHSVQGFKNYFDENRQIFEFNANLAIAVSADEYAKIFCDFKGYPPGLFPYGGCYYYSFQKTENKKKVTITYQVSNFIVSVCHFQLDNSNPEEPVNRYFLKIKPVKGRTVSCTVTANELASSGGLTTMFLQRARVLWEGDRKASLALARRIVETGAPVVRQLQITGYDRQSGCYVFKHFCVNPEGKILLPNKKGFFEISRTLQIRPSLHSTIKPVDGETHPRRIYELIWLTWGFRGITAVAWMVAGWFVNQIKAKIGFFPLLSFYGDTQTGKTLLTRILNACQCIDEEGLPMSKLNTAKGEIRKLAQRSGLFKAILESNTTESIRFNVNSILTLYNSNPLQTRALRTNDIQTHETPFLASILFVQNVEPFYTKAQKERAISIPFKSEHLNENTASALETLLQTPLTVIATFYQYIMRNREIIESLWFEEYESGKTDLMAGIGDARITENHALVLGFHRLLCRILERDYHLYPYIFGIGRLKQQECSRREETIADTFFSVLRTLDLSEDDSSNWFLERDNENRSYHYLHLQGALDKIRDERHAFNVPIKDLQASLKVHPAYVNNTKHYFFVNGDSKQFRCWLIDWEKIIAD
jgi:hypothetical protein